MSKRKGFNMNEEILKRFIPVDAKVIRSVSKANTFSIWFTMKDSYSVDKLTFIHKFGHWFIVL